MQIKYQSDDGQLFDSQKECEEYENAPTYLCFNYKFKLMENLTNDFLQQVKIINQAKYIVVLSQKGVDALKQVYSESSITDVGLYYWNDDMDVWYNLDMQIEDLYQELHELKKARDNIIPQIIALGIPTYEFWMPELES